MSNYGIAVSRAGSKIQIDGTHKNFSVYKEGTGAGRVGHYYFTISLYNPYTLTYDLTDKPLILLNVNNTEYASVNKCVGSTGHMYWDEATYQAYMGARVNCGATVFDVPYIVAAPPKMPRQHYGLEIYNDAGDAVFTSWEHYVELVAVHDFSRAASAAPADDDTTDVTVIDAVNNYFCLMPVNIMWHSVLGNTSMIYYTASMGKINSTSIRVHSAMRLGSYILDSGYYHGSVWDSDMQMLEFSPVHTLIAP